jgi:hypothetical protein
MPRINVDRYLATFEAAVMSHLHATGGMKIGDVIQVDGKPYQVTKMDGSTFWFSEEVTP